jgi:NAD(P)-dependent dehydrogenase (short-subunit alcohol dehydrogenase family)
MKIAILTGGSSGIGKATAIELARRGIGVILTYHANAEDGDAVVREIEKNNGKAMALKLDLSKRETFADFTQAVKKGLAEIWQRKTFDYLLNNGGTGGPMEFTEMTEEYFDRIFNTNFTGPVFLTQKLIGSMEDGGCIVNTSSSSSRQAFVGYSAYGPSKAALTSWTRYLAKELAPRQIRVNAVSPGPTHTNFGDGAFDKHPEFSEILGAQVALGRVGNPEDLAKVIVNLLSEDFGWVTAQDIEVSGGHLL